MEEENKFYVYVYLDPRKSGSFKYSEYEFNNEPFYVGKGINWRLRYHINEALNFKDNNKVKCDLIREIIKETGKEPIIIKYKKNLSNKESIKLEINMIATIGRKIKNEGPLTNITAGGEDLVGKNNPNYGNKWTLEQKEKMSNYQKIHSNFVLNNPQKINPNRGDKNGTNKYVYFVYKLNKNIMEEIYKTNSAIEIKERYEINTPKLYKVSNKNQWKGYFFIRFNKTDIIEEKELEQYKNMGYKKLIEYKVKQILFKDDLNKLKSNKIGLYKIYNDNKLIKKTYNTTEVMYIINNNESNKKFTKYLYGDKIINGAKYKNYFIKREDLTLEKMIEIINQSEIIN